MVLPPNGWQEKGLARSVLSAQTRMKMEGNLTVGSSLLRSDLEFVANVAKYLIYILLVTILALVAGTVIQFLPGTRVKISDGD